MSSQEQRMWELREDAKWGRDLETQKKAIQELGKIGKPAMGIIEEVMTVSSSKDIKDLCLEVINGIASVRAEAEKPQPEKKSEEKQVQEKKA